MDRNVGKEIKKLKKSDAPKVRPYLELIIYNLELIISPITFITGNQNKADYLAKYLGFPIDHHKLDLDEIQSLDLFEIVEHKVKQAFEIIGKPVIVEDVSLEFEAMGRLPGPFIRFFVDEIPFQTICDLVDGKSRKATAKCVFGYYDGITMKLFEGKMNGEVAIQPAGDGGFGWDKIFIPEGYGGLTRAQLDESDYQISYTKSKAFGPLKDFLLSLG